MKDQITLKTRILLFKITMISILVFTILNVFFIYTVNHQILLSTLLAKGI